MGFHGEGPRNKENELRKRPGILLSPRATARSKLLRHSP